MMTEPTADITRRVELERAEAARQALERAAVKLENWATGVVYGKAMRKAAQLVREEKPG